MCHAMSRRKTAPLAALSVASFSAHHGRSMGQLVFMVEFLVVVTGILGWLELLARFAVDSVAGR